MKIGIVAYTFYEIDHRVRRYAETLAEQGHDVEAVVLRESGQALKDALNGVKLYRIQERSYNEKNVLQHALRTIGFFLKGSFLLLRSHMRDGYDVLHINNMPDFLVFMGLVPKMLGTKLILDIHDVMPELYAQKSNRDLSGFLARALLWLERRSVRFADHTIVANDLWRKKIIRRDGIPPSRCCSILNYPNLSFFKKVPVQENSESLTIVYPGTISHHHGIDVALRALALVKREIKDVHLRIYTRSSNFKYVNSLKQLITELHLEDSVEFHDPVPAEELSKIFQNASMGVVPKRGGIFADEAFSTKIFDFMAVGLPIIASKTKIDDYYFDDSTIMFFKPDHYEDLARCIIKLHRDKRKRADLVKHGNDYVRLNNWENKKQEYVDLVHSLVCHKKM